MSVTMYSADNPPPARTTVLEAWSESNVAVTDGSERQLGKDAFLLLLLTQLQNQDPFNPMEDTEMTAQLAQYSQLEQLTNLNDNVTSMAGYIQAQNQFQTLSLIGKDVKAETNLLSVTGGEVDVFGGMEVSEACKIEVYIIDGNGQQVRMYDWGMTQPGTYDLNWDGRNNSGAKVPDGVYKFQVTATDASGNVLESGIVPFVNGKVSSVSFDEVGQPIIHLGNAQISLAQVIEILQSSSANAGTTGTTTTTPPVVAQPEPEPEPEPEPDDGGDGTSDVDEGAEGAGDGGDVDGDSGGSEETPEP
jgi:flagellar basal-body rod modification protein FlgD